MRGEFVVVSCKMMQSSPSSPRTPTGRKGHNDDEKRLETDGRQPGIYVL